MTVTRPSHLVERAFERMAPLDGVAAAPGSMGPVGPPPPPPRGPAAPPADGAPATGTPGAASTDLVAINELDPVSLATLETAGMVVAGARRSKVAEEWRITASQLLRSLKRMQPDDGPRGGFGRDEASPARSKRAADRELPPGANANLLMVTSSKPNEGKSFSSLNLAASLALGSGIQVLLMDIDSKPGALSELVGLHERPGLFDMVSDPALRPAGLVVPTAIPGLSVLPIGRPAAAGPVSTERTVTRAVVDTIGRIARQFPQWVLVMDSPPCLATSDASTMAPAVGQIAMIVEAERTQRDDLEAALELLRPCPNITLILNKIRLVKDRAFGDYHYYDA